MIAIVGIYEIEVITEKLIANAVGRSFRWRFQPWKKDSFDNEFEPERKYPTITMPTLPISTQLEMVKTVFKQRFAYIFKFKEDK